MQSFSSALVAVRSNNSSRIIGKNRRGKIQDAKKKGEKKDPSRASSFFSKFDVSIHAKGKKNCHLKKKKNIIKNATVINCNNNKGR